MLDELLFAALPYAALALLLGGPLWRHLGSARRRAAFPAAWAECVRLYRGSRPWRWGMGLLVAGHLLAFLLPMPVARLARIPGARLAVELAAGAAGLAALIGLGRLLRDVRAGSREAGRGGTLLGGAAEALFLTLVGLAIASGLTMALVYRWGSSWYLVTLVPYLRSLVRLAPNIPLAVDLPSLVKLHLLAGVASLAVLPFTPLGAALAWPFSRLVRRTKEALGETLGEPEERSA